MSIIKGVLAATFLYMEACKGSNSPPMTTSTVDHLGNVGYYSSMQIADGAPVISYANLKNGSYYLKLAVCNNETCTSPSITMVDPFGDLSWITSLQLSSTGSTICYNHKNNKEGLKLAVCNDIPCTTPIINTIDDSGDVGFNSLQLDGLGNAVISYYNRTNKHTTLAVCNDAACTAPIFATVDSLGEAHWINSLQLNSADNAMITYYDITNNHLKLAICNNRACSNPILRIIDSWGGVAWTWVGSIQLTTAGHVMISYCDGTNHQLKLARCSDAACTNPIITIVDAFEGLGGFSSLQLDNAGYAVISYKDNVNNSVKLAACNDIACTDPLITIVDYMGADSYFSTLQLNSAGNAFISYHDAITQDLKLSYVILNPTLSPSATPTTAPSQTLSVSPTTLPSRTPTQTPSSTPTTPAPTLPPKISCGNIISGDYNDNPLSFEVNIPEQGDIIFNASQSNFAITSLTAVFGATPIGSDTDYDGILTLSDLKVVGTYFFTIRAKNGVYGTFKVHVLCLFSNSRQIATTTLSSPTHTMTNTKLIIGAQDVSKQEDISLLIVVTIFCFCFSAIIICSGFIYYIYKRHHANRASAKNQVTKVASLSNKQLKKSESPSVIYTNPAENKQNPKDIEPEQGHNTREGEIELFPTTVGGEEASMDVENIVIVAQEKDDSGVDAIINQADDNDIIEEVNETPGNIEQEEIQITPQ